MTPPTRRLLVVTPSYKQASKHVLAHHPELVDGPYWRWVHRTRDLSGCSRDRYDLVLLPGHQALPEWPTMSATIRLLRLPLLPQRVNGKTRPPATGPVPAPPAGGDRG